MPQNNLEVMKHVNLEILKERVSQNKKWGKQNHSMEKWLVILIEEIGEVAQAMQNGEYASKPTDAQHLYEELIQAAGVASAMAEQVLEQG